MVLNATHPICRGHKVTFRRFGGRLLARLIVADGDMLPASYVPTSAVNASEGEGGLTAMGLREWADPQNPAWDPRWLQLTDEVSKDRYIQRKDGSLMRGGRGVCILPDVGRWCDDWGETGHPPRFDD